MKKTILDLQDMARQDEKITMMTAYDYPTARVLEEAGVDTILVGDSLGMVILGYESTVQVTLEDMVHHSKAARRGAPQTFMIADLPYLSYALPEKALENSGRLIQEGGADAVKLEGGVHYAETVALLTKSGVPVVGHIGLTPQTATQLGGFKVQGKSMESARQLLADARALEQAGAVMIVLEAIPSKLAAAITSSLNIPTIGIGAGPDCGGQVLVVHDALGFYDRFVPRFVKQYEQLNQKMVKAVQDYCREVKSGEFPSEKHMFSVNEEVLKGLYGAEN